MCAREAQPGSMSRWHVYHDQGRGRARPRIGAPPTNASLRHAEPRPAVLRVRIVPWLMWAVSRVYALNTSRVTPSSAMPVHTKFSTTEPLKPQFAKPAMTLSNNGIMIAQYASAWPITSDAPAPHCATNRPGADQGLRTLSGATWSNLQWRGTGGGAKAEGRDPAWGACSAEGQLHGQSGVWVGVWVGATARVLACTGGGPTAWL